MTKKSACIIIFALVFITSSVSLGWYFFRYYLTLTWSDLVFAWDASKHVELSRSETNEEYFNRWLCFYAKNVEVSEAIIEYGKVRKVPLIDAKFARSLFQFNVDPEVDWNTDALQNRWRALLENQESVCIFSMYSQTDDDGTEVRYIRRGKTRGGFWDKVGKALETICAFANTKGG